MLLSPLGLRGRGRGRGLQAADRREREQLLRRPPVQVRLRDGVRTPLQSRIKHINIYSGVHPVSLNVLNSSHGWRATPVRLATARADPSGLKQIAMTKHSDRLDEKRCKMSHDK